MSRINIELPFDLLMRVKTVNNSQKEKGSKETQAETVRNLIELGVKTYQNKKK